VMTVLSAVEGRYGSQGVLCSLEQELKYIYRALLRHIVPHLPIMHVQLPTE
jgi:hypothetical protein